MSRASAAPPTDPVAAIQDHDRGRDPERLALKYQRLAGDPFAFFRGTAHLFWGALRALPPAADSPVVWCVGDLHLENFGVFTGDDGGRAFDVNDFDEVTLAPAAWDVLRLLASLWVAAPLVGLSERDTGQMAARCLDRYLAALAEGKPRPFRPGPAESLVAAKLASLGDRDVAAFHRKRIESRAGKLQLRTDTGKALSTSPAERSALMALLPEILRAAGLPSETPLLDVARRVAGKGSLGVQRFVLLLTPNDTSSPLLLDVKQALPPSLPAVRPLEFTSDADRVARLAQWMPAVPALHLGAVGPYVVRALQPGEDKVDVLAEGRDAAALSAYVERLGTLSAWAHLRAGGRRGADPVDRLVEHAFDPDFRSTMLSRAAEAAARNDSDFRAFLSWRVRLARPLKGAP